MFVFLHMPLDVYHLLDEVPQVFGNLFRSNPFSSRISEVFFPGRDLDAPDTIRIPQEQTDLRSAFPCFRELED